MCNALARFFAGEGGEHREPGEGDCFPQLRTALARGYILTMLPSMRLLHTMIRVNNLDESLKFYCEALGMKLLRRHDFPAGEFTLAFVGYGTEADNAVIELTYNYGKSSYNLGDAFGHLAIGVDDIYKTCADLKARGVKVVREPGPMKHGTTPIAFVEDPNGYKIELIERKGAAA